MRVLNHLLGREKYLSKATEGDHNILIQNWADYLFSSLSVKWIALIILTSTILFLLGYCGHPEYPNSNIFPGQANDLILSHFKEEYHSFIKDEFSNKKIQLVSLYYIYKTKTNASRKKKTNDYEQAYNFGPLYGGECTGFHRHMISVVLFSYSKTLKSMLVDYAATEMGSLDDYLDAAP